LSYQPFTIKSLAVFALFFLYFLPIQLIHEIQDQKIDRDQGQHNTFQILGFKKTKSLIQISLIAYLLTSVFFWKWQILSPIAAVSSMIFAITMLCYIGAFRDLPAKSIKLDARHLSILYGAALLITFYYKV
jgi:4-hydroxybenzoate polyprenyltransferase